MPPASVPYPLGVRLSGDGVHVAVLAPQADDVELCLLDGDHPEGSPKLERRVRLGHLTHGVWHDHVPGVRAGQRYGFRVHGEWDPLRGLRHNASKLLLDPYARLVEGRLAYRPEIFGHLVGNDLTGEAWDGATLDQRDSAPYVPHSVVPHPEVDAGFDWADDAPLGIPWEETVLYEAHVRGLTRCLPGVPDDLRGTYAGLAHPATLHHLLRLGVTSVELLPVHAFASEPALVQRGLTNYWGYNTLGFFSPHLPYASARDPHGALAEFKGMVKLLHAAGIEVLLDVVYNHTCEAGGEGPTLAWRGLDNAGYYRLTADGRDVDVTGCGNTLDFGNPRVVQLVLDSLRYWHVEAHVDGFRFDLATSLARGRDGGFDPDHPLLVALRADPALAGAKLVAEPWDLGPHGWRTGQFPAPLAEWNDRFRDCARSFWLADGARVAAGGPGSGVRDLATRLAGSADSFAGGRPGEVRGPLGSVNYVAAHDGFTLADTTAYEAKHNELNGEANRDGTDDNRSWNHGVEGSTHDPAVLLARQASMRALLGTLLLATGIPMLAAGDELGRTQLGNNNAYCQDNELSWVDWNVSAWQQDLLDTTTHLIALRRALPALRQGTVFAGRPVHEDGTKDLAWFASDGTEMDIERWHDPHCRTLQMYLAGQPAGGRSVLLVVHGGAEAAEVVLPPPPWATGYSALWDSSLARPDGDTVALLAGLDDVDAGDRPPAAIAGRPVAVEAFSLRLFAVHRNEFRR